MRQIWPWRDWVIRAIDRNVPFDQFMRAWNKSGARSETVYNPKFLTAQSCATERLIRARFVRRSI